MSAVSDAVSPGKTAGAVALTPAAGHDHHTAPHAHEAGDAPGHSHNHSHNHDHSGHSHGHDHHHGAAAARSLPEPQMPGFSLMRASLGERLALAAGFSALLWVAIAGVLWL